LDCVSGSPVEALSNAVAFLIGNGRARPFEASHESGHGYRGVEPDQHMDVIADTPDLKNVAPLLPCHRSQESPKEFDHPEIDQRPP